MNLNNRRGLLFILVGLVAALAAGVVVFILAMNLGNSAAQNSLAASIPPTPVSSREVIVAAQDIDPNTIITTTMILTASYPSDLIPSDAFTNTAELLGTTSKQKILSGLPLLRRQFVPASGRQGTSIIIPKGKLLVGFPAAGILNSTGAIKQGDHVDILLTLPISGTTRLDNSAGAGSQLPGNTSIVSQETMQNIEVYNTGEITADGNGRAQQGAATTITFIVDPQEALILKYIKESGGNIDLVLRSLEDNEQHATDPVNLDYIVDLYKFISLPKAKP